MTSYAAFQHRDYRLLFSATLLSALGQQMLSVAISWDLYEKTHSALVLGNVGLVQVVPAILLALFAGHLADRRDRRTIILSTQSMHTLAGLSLALSGAGRSVALMYAAIFFVAVARAFQAPASNALLPQLVPPRDLLNAVTWNSSAFEFSSLAGPALAGILIGIGGSSLVYVLQAACALLTIACFSSVRFRPQPVTTTHPPGLHGIAEGLRFVWREKLMLSTFTLDLFAVLFGGATALLPIYAVDILHVGVTGLGWLRAAPAAGALSMAVLLAHSPPFPRPGKMLLACVAGFGVATIVFGYSRSFWLSLFMLMLTGMFDNVSVVLRSTLVQSRTPDELRGRVHAVRNIFISCSNQLGAVESGVAAAALGTVFSVVSGGAMTLLVVAVIGGVSVSLREWKKEERGA